MTEATSRWLALGAVLALAAMLLNPLGPVSAVVAAPLGLLVIAGVLRAARWAIATAVLMLPYFSYGVMDILTNAAGRSRALLFSVLTLVAFFAALDSLRRS